MYTNVIEQIAESEIELKKCLNSFHIDYFVYKSTLKNFVNLFELMTNEPKRLSEFLNDRRISRAYEACLIVVGDKVATQAAADELHWKRVKKSLTNLADYLAENFQTILETENGVFAVRSFLRVVGEIDELEEPAASSDARSSKKHQHEFNVKKLPVKLVPPEWKLNKYIKKFAKCLSEINVLGEFGLSS